MTLKEAKENVLSLIEELNPKHELLTDDPDIAEKIHTVINQVQFELARIKKIPTYSTEEVTADEVFELNNLVDFYQLNVLKFKNKEGEEAEYTLVDNMAIFSEDGQATFFYYKYPERIKKDTKVSYEFELSEDVLELLPYGVAADLLKSDVSTNYGKIYAERYETMLQRLDPRYSLDDSVFIEGGVDF